MNKVLFSTLTLALVALAGCADDPPAGSFTATNPAADFSVLTVVVDATPPSNGYAPLNGPNNEECGLDTLTDILNDNGGNGAFPSCEGATSTVSTPGGATLPEVPETMLYSLWAVDANGEQALGTFEHHGGFHYQYPTTTFDGQDFSSLTEVQIRFGSTVVATAPGGGGAFTLAAGLDALSASVEYSGKELTVSVADAPADASLVGWLVDVDENGIKTHAEDFVLSGNSTVYMADVNIGDYEEFHIHVGDSSINVAVAAIE